MRIRNALEIVIEALFLSLILALLVASPPILHLFSLEGWTDFILTLLGTWLVLFLLAVPVARRLRLQRKEQAEINRADEERYKRRAEAEENYRLEDRTLKQPLLHDLRAIARGDKTRLGPEAVDAAKRLRMRYGEHPETVIEWTPLLNDLTAEAVKDANGIKRRINELLYPDNLEDVEALKRRQADCLKKLARGEQLDPEAAEAGKALGEYHEIRRLKNEEELAEAKREREKEERRRKERIAHLEEEIARKKGKKFVEDLNEDLKERLRKLNESGE
jgi:hypothetical protein